VLARYSAEAQPSITRRCFRGDERGIFVQRIIKAEHEKRIEQRAA